MTGSDVLLLSVAAANLAVGLYAFALRPRERARQAFLLLVIGGTLWVGGFTLLSVTRDFAFDIVTNAGGVLFIGSIFWFSLLFPARMKIPVRPWLALLPLVLFGVTAVPQHLIVSGISTGSDGALVPVLGPLLPLWSLLAFTYTLATIAVLVVRIRGAKGRERLQLGYFFLGIAIFASCAVLFDTVLPVLTGDTELNALGPLSSIAFTGLTAYAMVRHQLMDIRIIIQRGLIYSVLIGIILVAYVTLIDVLGVIAGTAQPQILVSALLTSMLGIFTVPLIERFFRRVTDPWFFKATYDYAEALDTLSDSIEAHIELHELIRATEACLAGILRAAYVRIRLMDEEAGGPGAFSVPIMRSGSAIGAITVGPKRSGDLYDARDLMLVRTFARQAATAFERARLYEEVSRHATELSETVAARTRELRESQERERQTMADISHNLQTPLAVIQTRIDAMKRHALYDGEMRSFEQSLASLSTFIYDLLALARLDRSPDQESRLVDLSALMRDIGEEIGTIAAARGITVSLAIRPGIQMRGDARLLREAVMNVASNAVKYMNSHGEKRIRFTLARSDGRVQLCVVDTGIGIDPEDQPRVFERFYRGRDASYGIRGTGLGLAIAKRIVERHGGVIELTSELGRGTTFCLSFPETGA